MEKQTLKKARPRGVRAAVVAGERGTEQAFGRAGLILDALAAARRTGLRFTDIVSATGFSKATVHRLLAGMLAHDLVANADERGRFYLGHRLAGWGAAARDRYGFLELVGPHLDALAARTGETIYFSVRSGPMSLCVAQREGTNPIRVLSLAPGDRNALGVGSASLALLAFLPQAEIDAILADPDHCRARERRGVGETAIRELVSDARRRGYAFVLDLIPGIAAIGVPVPADGAVPAAALAIATITARLEGGQLDEALAALRGTAETIGETLARNADLRLPG